MGQAHYTEALGRAGAAALDALRGLEAAQRRLHPPDLPGLRERLAPLAERLESAREALVAAPVPAGLEPFHEQLLAGVASADAALRSFARSDDPVHGVARVLDAMRLHCRAQEALYPLRQVLPPLGRHFAETTWHARLEALDPEPPSGTSVGVHAAGEPEGRGGFHLYVPERYDARAPHPLVVALHGGFGHGRDFLWTWLREARSRGFLLLAPTSRGTTWSLQLPDVDAPALCSMIDTVCEGWRVDRARILLVGLSDGGTYALLAGIGGAVPCAAMACVAGVLHPRLFAEPGGLARAAGRRVMIVHGALDWMFPVALARAARDALAQAGAEVAYREIADLSHTWPREENARILAWFDAGLGSP